MSKGGIKTGLGMLAEELSCLGRHRPQNVFLVLQKGDLVKKTHTKGKGGSWEFPEHPTL